MHSPTSSSTLRLLIPICVALSACEPRVDAPVWVDLVAKPCALSDDGSVTCWTSESWLPIDQLEDVPNTDVVSLQSESNGVLRGLDVEGNTRVLHCPELPYDLCPLVNEPVIQVTDYGGLTADGQLVLDGNHDLTPVPEADWLVAADHLLAAIDTTRTLFFPRSPGVELTVPGNPVALVADRLGTDTGACVLDDTGTITCAGFGRWTESWFDDPPYRELRGAHGGLCALRGESTLHCNDGNTYDWGPLTTFAVAGYSYYDDTGAFVPSTEAAVSVCGLLETGSIVCEGPRYPVDLLDALAMMSP